MNNPPKKQRSRSRIVTVNITCPLVLYENGRLEWEKRGYNGPADVFQATLRKLTKLEIPV